MPIPDPQPGLVVGYSYLWRHDRLAGHEEGVKDRPAVIVLATSRPGEDTPIVTVLPITHRAPANPAAAIEIPPGVKRHLGLDEARSWIVVAESNEFRWPGYDLRKVPAADRYDYGFLPPRFFARVTAAFAAFHYSRKGTVTLRN